MPDKWHLQCNKFWPFYCRDKSMHCVFRSWGGGLQMLQLLSVGFTPLVNASLHVPLQTTLPWQTQGEIDPCRWSPTPIDVHGSLGSRTQCPLGPCRTDHLWQHTPASSGTLHHDCWGCWCRGKICIPSACSCHNKINWNPRWGGCLSLTLCLLPLDLPAIQSLTLLSSQQQARASSPIRKGNSLVETEWVRWFK